MSVFVISVNVDFVAVDIVVVSVDVDAIQMLKLC